MAHDHQAAAHHSADDEYLETPPGAGHEYTDANVWIIVKFGFWLLVSAVVIHLGLGLMFGLFVQQRERTTEPEFPLAIEQDRLPSGPRLQRFPANEMQDFLQREKATLESYGWVDQNAGTVYIPISEAMRLTVERGLPVRTAPPAGEAAAAGAEAEDLMPADSSSGRTLERARRTIQTRK